MSPAQTSSRLRDIATRLKAQHRRVIAAELALRGFDPAREEIVAEEQIEAISEVLQHIAQHLDQTAAGLIHEADRNERSAAHVA